MRHAWVVGIALFLFACLFGCSSDRQTTGAWGFEGYGPDSGAAADTGEDDPQPPSDTLESPRDTRPPPPDTGRDFRDIPEYRDTPRRHHEFFVGLWLVEQPYHATYEATLYDFGADGALTEVESTSLGGHPLPTGTVAKCAGDGGDDVCCPSRHFETSCKFGNRWWSRSPRELVVLGDCDDGRTRPIVLRHPREGRVTVESVDGDAGWCHPHWRWAWKKCESKDCLPKQ